MRWFLDNRRDLAGQRHAGEGGAAASIAAGDPVARAPGQVLRYHARRERVPLAATASARCRRCTSDAALPVLPSAARSSASTTSRANRRPGSSAATRTGAGRSGCRSTICWSRRSSATTTSTATSCRSSARPARARLTSGGGARAVARAWPRSSWPTPDGRRPCHGGDARYADDPHWRDLVLFHEYFHGDDRPRPRRQPPDRWTALVLRLIEDLARDRPSATVDWGSSDARDERFGLLPEPRCRRRVARRWASSRTGCSRRSRRR